jgi:hypothetical protein
MFFSMTRPDERVEESKFKKQSRSITAGPPWHSLLTRTCLTESMNVHNEKKTIAFRVLNRTGVPLGFATLRTRASATELFFSLMCSARRGDE